MTERERLMELMINADTYDSYECKLCTKDDDACDCCYAEKLADHLLANGVIVPPCKVGDTVYAVSNNKVYTTKVFSMIAESEDKKWVHILKCNIFNGISMFKKFIFGKTVFFTREEAERALKGGEG